MIVNTSIGVTQTINGVITTTSTVGLTGYDNVATFIIQLEVPLRFLGSI